MNNNQKVGTINGDSAVEFDMESLEEKPWRKPGADITDYFNYGFTEETWTAYCNRYTRRIKLVKRRKQFSSFDSRSPGLGFFSFGTHKLLR